MAYSKLRANRNREIYYNVIKQKPCQHQYVLYATDRYEDLLCCELCGNFKSVEGKEDV